jgi:hypothetical protein
MVTVVVEATAAVAMLKLGEAVAPAATVTEAGTEAIAGFELERLKTNPPAGAGLAKVTLFGVGVLPPFTVAAARLKETPNGLTVRMAVAVDPFTLAVMVTGVLAATAVVATVKLDEAVAPAATATVAGTDATA